MNPKARSEGVVIQEVGPDLVIYHKQTDRSHTLNVSAARLYRGCDGTRSVDELRSLFPELADQEQALAVVMAGLRQIERAGLLESPVEAAADLSRRSVLLKVAALVAIPVVLSVSTPAKAQVASQAARHDGVDRISEGDDGSDGPLIDGNGTDGSDGTVP